MLPFSLHFIGNHHFHQLMGPPRPSEVLHTFCLY